MLYVWCLFLGCHAFFFVIKLGAVSVDFGLLSLLFFRTDHCVTQRALVDCNCCVNLRI
jgi:hypothetical protein